ncbi:hypothetical protein CEE39_04430 [bacterium (candidate division B38) B3_B38]|nr:MAG: hypothetical protein CEE39_04430 [bacterium (candidate division B38) B3_B38]
MERILKGRSGAWLLRAGSLFLLYLFLCILYSSHGASHPLIPPLLSSVGNPREVLLYQNEEKIDFRAFSHKGYTRLVVESGEYLPCSIFEDAGQLVVYFPLRVSPPWKKKTLDDGVVNQLTFYVGSSNSTLVISLGSYFKAYNTFHLEKPNRIVIDLYRQLPTTNPTIERINPSTAEQERTPPIPNPSPAIQTVVLDPGHGGDDVGAKGRTGLLEKEVVLDITRMLRQLLTSNLDVNVVLTRETDENLPLEQRTAKANNVKGDLFISIHTNASRKRGVKGAETFFMSYEPTDDESSQLAARENFPIVLGDPTLASDLQLTLWDMAQAEYLNESSQLAEIIQQELNLRLNIENRGIKQAPFAVLMGAAMPAVLIEVGFISNSSEERELRTESYRQKIAYSLFRSISNFIQLYERKTGNYPLQY